MRTLHEYSIRSTPDFVRRPSVTKASRTQWLIDDFGRMAALHSHPATLWSMGFDGTIKEILELGFVYIEDRAKSLFLKLIASRVQAATLAGTFYFIALRRPKRIIILSDDSTESEHYTIVYDINDVYGVLEKMATSLHAESFSIADRLENNTGNGRIRYT
jgi:hypothetical protein